MKTETSIKQEQIIEAALKRFAHFGIGKTTMTEIAEDLCLTKQALSHYFPDKQSLIHSSVEKLSLEFIHDLEKEIHLSKTVQEALSKHTHVKARFFEKYYMLIIQTDQSAFAHQSAYSNWRSSLKEKEAVLLSALFEKGMYSGELKPLNTQKTAELFLDTLYAFSRCVKEKGDLPDAEAFKQVLIRQQEVINIFYQGLKAESWKDHSKHN